MTRARVGHVGASLLAGPVLICAIGGRTVSGEDGGQKTPQAEAAAPSQGASEKFQLRFEVKAGARSSRDVRLQTGFPFPPEMVPAGETAVFLKTVDKGTSLEVSSVTVQASGQLTPRISARVDVRFPELYNRNPTSSDDLIALREAWLRFGVKPEVLWEDRGTTFYAQVGKFPRFSRRAVRSLESYGLWSTAVGRFEEIGLEVGGRLGGHLYWRTSLTNGNPLFFRDSNALAGDNGAPERLSEHPDPVFESGFPMLYDAKAQDTNLDDRFMLGAGLGARWLAEDLERGLDILGWYYERRMEDAARIRGSFYEGDLDLLGGAGIPLPFAGRDKWECGVSAEGRWRRLRGFAQFVSQEIAGLDRHGIEAELAWRIPLNGVLVSGDEPVLNWLDLLARYSRIDNGFAMPANFVAPSVGHNRRKLDVGFRLGIMRGVDLTAEYTINELFTGTGVLRPNEGLLTLRVAF